VKQKWTFTPAAHSDFDKIGDHIARDSPQRSEAFLQRLVTGCDRIANSPRTGQKVALRYAPAGTRQINEGNYKIYYQPGKDSVSILRIINSKQDQQRVFEKERHHERSEQSEIERELKEFNRVKEERTDLQRWRELKSEREERQLDRHAREEKELKDKFFNGWKLPFELRRQRFC